MKSTPSRHLSRMTTTGALRAAASAMAAPSHKIHAPQTWEEDLPATKPAPQCSPAKAAREAAHLPKPPPQQQPKPTPQQQQQQDSPLQSADPAALLGSLFKEGDMARMMLAVLAQQSMEEFITITPPLAEAGGYLDADLLLGAAMAANATPWAHVMTNLPAWQTLMHYSCVEANTRSVDAVKANAAHLRGDLVLSHTGVDADAWEGPVTWVPSYVPNAPQYRVLEKGKPFAHFTAFFSSLVEMRRPMSRASILLETSTLIMHATSYAALCCTVADVDVTDATVVDAAAVSPLRGLFNGCGIDANPFLPASPVFGKAMAYPCKVVERHASEFPIDARLLLPGAKNNHSNDFFPFLTRFVLTRKGDYRQATIVTNTIDAAYAGVIVFSPKKLVLMTCRDDDTKVSPAAISEAFAAVVGASGEGCPLTDLLIAGCRTVKHSRNVIRRATAEEEQQHLASAASVDDVFVVEAPVLYDGSAPPPPAVLAQVPEPLRTAPRSGPMLVAGRSTRRICYHETIVDPCCGDDDDEAESSPVPSTRLFTVEYRYYFLDLRRRAKDPTSRVHGLYPFAQEDK